MYAELFQFPPGREGYYGDFGGAFIPEVLHETMRELTEAFAAAQADPHFWAEYGVDGELLWASDTCDTS